MDERLKAAHSKLKEMRTRTDLSLKATPLLRSTFTDFDGSEKPLKIRYYQVQGILHLVAMKRFLLGDDTGIGKCCIGSTLVRTNRGLIPIQDLNPGITEPDTFAPLTGVSVEFGRSQLPVKRFYYGGEKPTIRLRTRCGYELGGSLIHPVMVRRDGKDQWVRLRELKEGDFVAIARESSKEAVQEEPLLPHPGAGAPSERSHQFPERMTPDLARLLGYIVAEAWCCHPQQYFMTLSQSMELNPEVHADMLSLVSTLFAYKMHTTPVGHVLSSTQILRFLRDIGVSPVLSKDKEVPWAVLQSTSQSVREFLRGYVDAESSADDLGIEVSSASETLLKQVQVMLLGFGVVSSRSPKRVSGYDHIYWRLTIQGEDVRTFVREIGLVSQRKLNALAKVLENSSNPNLDVIPMAVAEIEDLRTELYARVGRHGHKGGGISKQWGSAFYTTLQHIRTGRRNPTYQYLDRLLKIAAEAGISELNPAYARVAELVQNKWFYDPIESLEDGWEEVFDIEVDDPRHAFIGNGLVNHNTLQAISSLCFVWAKEPERKVIVLTNKSLVGQWALEFEKFCMPGEIQVFECTGSPAKRAKVYKEFFSATGPTVLVLGYATARQDIRLLQDSKGHVLITDEASAYCNPATQTYQVVRHLGDPERADRHWALTATLIKNDLMEGYGIYSVLVPGLFPPTKNKFMNEYCMTRLQSIPGSRRQVPVIIGYRKDQITRFRDMIDPYFLSRAKFEVATELPVLTIREHKVGMTKAQETKYREALSGLLEIDQTGEEKETTKLTALIYCQQIVDHPGLVECDGDSEKMDALFELLTEGDLANDKIIVYSRFRKMIDLLEKTSSAKPYQLKTVRVTGAEDESQRKAAMKQFQDPSSDIRVCWITDAAKEGVNLQAAKAIVFYDSPWSAGDYLQVLGRMLRIGSAHDRCYAIHMVARGTIDVQVMAVIRKKMQLIEQVMGRRIKGDNEDSMVVSDKNSVDDLFSAMTQEARRLRGLL